MSNVVDQAKQLRADFERTPPGTPLLHFIVIAGTTGAQAADHWRWIVPEAVSNVGHYEGRFADHAPWWVAHFYLTQSSAGGLEALQRFDHLARVALKTLQGLSVDGIACPGVNGQSAGFGVLWLSLICQLAWRGNTPWISADRYRAIVLDPDENTRQVQFLTEGQPMRDGWRLLFPHAFFCKLQPDIFSASAKVVDLFLSLGKPELAVYKASKERKPDWSPPIPKSRIKAALRMNDRQFRNWLAEHSLALRAGSGTLVTAKQLQVDLQDGSLNRSHRVLLAELIELRARPALVAR